MTRTSILPFRLTLLLAASGFLVPLVGCHPSASAPTRLKCGVAPYFPTPSENHRQFDPFFTDLAQQVDLPAEVTVTEDWIGISEALRSRTLDVGWLGPWGYVLAHHADPSMQAIATVKYNDRPTYHAVLLARADASFSTLDEAIALSQKSPRLRLSLADVGSTSGWLIPQAEFKRRRLDPKEVFEYSEGAPHSAQAIALLEKQTDLASDYDRNLDVLAESGRIERSKLKIIWQSDPLPNDPIVVRGGFPADLKKKLQERLVRLSPEEAQRLLPKHYTGFVTSDGGNYSVIEEAGKAVGKLK